MAEVESLDLAPSITKHTADDYAFKDRGSPLSLHASPGFPEFVGAGQGAEKLKETAKFNDRFVIKPANSQS